MGNSKKTFNLRISKELDSEMKKFCRINNYSGRSELARHALRDYLDRKKQHKLTFKIKI